jgi:hypothetical protein
MVCSWSQAYALHYQIHIMQRCANQTVKIQACLKSIVEKSPHVGSLFVEINGESHALVNYVNSSLSGVRDEASVLLDRFEKLKQSKSSRLKEQLTFGLLSIRFVLERSTILPLIQAVEKAQSCLQLSLVLAHLHSSDSW